MERLLKINVHFRDMSYAAGEDTHVTLEEPSILVIFHSTGEKRDSADEKQGPQSLGDPGTRARTGRHFAPIVAGRFIHVWGHPRPPQLAMKRGHYHRVPFKRASSRVNFVPKVLGVFF